ncbi:MAG: hypothetical protein H8E37_08295 [Planctomycetes bacterium]|nr:hypothetical protein [Planctomycetota bacterium]
MRAITGQDPRDQSLPVIQRDRERPRCLSRACVDLVQDTLARGVPLLLARQGWHADRTICGESVVQGRLWQRAKSEQLALEYSRNTLEFLIWLTGNNPVRAGAKPKIAFEDCSTGDSVLFLLAFTSLREISQARPTLIHMPIFLANPLVGLMFPDDFTDEDFVGAPEFGRWVEPKRAWLLEAMQPWLRARWFDMEMEKRQLVARENLQAVGEAQQAVLDAFFSAAEQAGRRDLTRFVMDVSVRLLRAHAGIDGNQPWFERVQVGDLRIADRQAVYESGLVLLRSLERLDAWNEAARTIGYYDEEYETSQLWKSDWERWNGDSVVRQAREVVQSTAEFNV